MAVCYRTEGFVFKKDDRFEADRIFTVFCRDFGKIKVLGRAIRKIASKLRSGIDIFYLSEIEFIQGKSQKTLTDAIALEKFKNIGKDLIKLKTSYQIAQILDRFIKGSEKDDKIWDLIAETFEKLNRQEPENIYYFFLWNFFSILGYKPELFHCVICQKKLNPDIIYFSSKEGGTICHICGKNRLATQRARPEQYRRVDSDLIKILRLILKNSWQIVSRLKIQPPLQKLLKEVSEDYCSYLCSEDRGTGFKPESI
jgi:DNA repair protein RecO (recombination protein O)